MLGWRSLFEIRGGVKKPLPVNCLVKHFTATAKDPLRSGRVCDYAAACF